VRTVFVASSDGNLYKVVADTGQVSSTANEGNGPGSVDLQRPGCPADSLKGSPVVQLGGDSSVAFNAAYGVDALGKPRTLVYLTTSFDTRGVCPTHTANQIIAVDAEMIDVVWRFNTPVATSGGSVSVFVLKGQINQTSKVEARSGA
jgi:hypothetical protein